MFLQVVMHAVGLKCENAVLIVHRRFGDIKSIEPVIGKTLKSFSRHTELSLNILDRNVIKGVKEVS